MFPIQVLGISTQIVSPEIAKYLYLGSQRVTITIIIIIDQVIITIFCKRWFYIALEILVLTWLNSMLRRLVVSYDFYRETYLTKNSGAANQQSYRYVITVIW